MKYARNEIFIGTFPNGDTIKYKITEFDGDCVYAIDINTGKRYAWDRRTYEKNNNIKFDDYME